MSVEQEMQRMQEKLDRLEKTNARLVRTNENLERTISEKIPVNGMFKNVSLQHGELEAKNTLFGFDDLGSYVMPANNRIPDKAANRYFMANSPEVATHDVADLLRKLALSVYGTKKNSTVQTHFEQVQVSEVYYKLKQVWLEAYEQRLKDLEVM